MAFQEIGPIGRIPRNEWFAAELTRLKAVFQKKLTRNLTNVVIGTDVLENVLPFSLPVSPNTAILDRANQLSVSIRCHFTRLKTFDEQVYCLDPLLHGRHLNHVNRHTSGTFIHSFIHIFLYSSFFHHKKLWLL